MTDENTLNDVRSLLTRYRERLNEHKKTWERYKK